MTKKYLKKLYVGEATDSFRYRWNNYKDNDRKHSRKESCMQEHLLKHFNSMGQNGFLHNVSITLIDKTDGKNPKKRDDYWRRTVKTYSPFGLNVEDSVCPSRYSLISDIWVTFLRYSLEFG